MKQFFLSLFSILIYIIAPLCLADTLFIQDNAKVLNPGLTAKLETTLKEIETKNGFHLEVVILPNFYNREPKAVMTAYIEQLNHNSHETQKNAMLMIILDNDQVTFYASPKLGVIFDKNNIQAITERVKDLLIKKQYDEMVRVGIADIYHFYMKNSLQGQNPLSLSNILNTILIIGVLLVVIFFIRKMPKDENKA